MFGGEKHILHDKICEGLFSVEIHEIVLACKIIVSFMSVMQSVS